MNKVKIKAIIKKIPVLNKLGHSFLEKRRNQKHLKTINWSDYNSLSIYLENEDEKLSKGNHKLNNLKTELNLYRQEQINKWDSFIYCGGYYYQGYLKIGINGIKPTEPRMKKYDLDSYFNKSKSVLDIGSNSGFITHYLSERNKKCTGIELNPYLIKMSNAVKNYFDSENLKFIEADFISHQFQDKFDIVFSLSNHFTIDGNLNTTFENYIKKIYHLMHQNGTLFLESHNINGDDQDMYEKLCIANKYFDLIKYKMVTAQYPADIDKLFIILKRKNVVQQKKDEIQFDLEVAKKQYSYHDFN